MNTNYLLPNRFKVIGWLLFIIGVLSGIMFLIYETEITFFNVKTFAFAYEGLFNKTQFFSSLENNLLDELTSILLIVGALLIAFSKQKTEDEFITKIRLESLVWAIYANYAILILAIIFVYEMTFFWILTFNMFTILIFFIFRFYWAFYRAKKQIIDEE